MVAICTGVGREASKDCLRFRNLSVLPTLCVIRPVFLECLLRYLPTASGISHFALQPIEPLYISSAGRSGPPRAGFNG